MNIMASEAAMLLCFSNLKLIIMLQHDSLSAFCHDDKYAIKKVTFLSNFCIYV